MIEAYIKRNMFGLDPEKKIHRIFRSSHLKADKGNKVITLPLASGEIWNDPLENPLSSITGVDEATNAPIDYGSLVRRFHALCWTHREKATSSDWHSFSHDEPATRITTSARKLLSRLFDTCDSGYMNRTWLVQVEYSVGEKIKELQNVHEVQKRIESTGAQLALSVATVRSDYEHEDEVRLLYDTSICPLPPEVALDESKRLVRIPFDWDDFIENQEDNPFH